MAQLYFHLGMHEMPAQYDHFFRSYPDYGAHRAGFCINAGLDWLLDWMNSVRFGPVELELMRSMRSRTGLRVFSEDFLAWLAESGHFGAISLQAIPEGRVVHAHVPLTVVRGPLAMAQILETPLLNILNYQTLVATKAARLRESAGDALILEFGARRAHDRGGNAGTRAALIGGADFSSNAGISHVLGLQPKGTHGHSLVQAFLSQGLTELEAFRAYAQIFPDECLLLVDTVDTLQSGVPNAIRVFEELRQKGYAPVGVRLDSGDLAYLSIQTAKLLDDAGFPETSIVLSNNLDEMLIWQIKTQIAQEAARYGVNGDRIIRRLVYGVGTRLITSEGDSSLGGVYKLVALQGRNGWQPTIKVSDDPGKTPIPGNKRVWRVYDERDRATADLLTLEDEDPAKRWREAAFLSGNNVRDSSSFLMLRHPRQRANLRPLPLDQISYIEPLLENVLADGRQLRASGDIEQFRAQRRADVERLDSGVRRLINPQPYHVSVSERLWELQEGLLEDLSPSRADADS